MKTFKDFVYRIHNQLNEAVPEHLRHIPDSWEHHSRVSPDTEQKMTNAFGSKGFKIVPLPKEAPDIDSDVAEHLTKHNWQVTDYAKGMASKKTTTSGNVSKGILPQEKIVHKKIGAILDETNAEDHVKKAFINDPARARAENNDLAILHTTTPHGIADMSGADTSWQNQSCMALPHGSNSSFLEQDSKHGSSVAYLIHKDDVGANTEGVPTKALARIVNKPMHEEKDNINSDTILRAEPKDWGNGGTSFTNANNRFLQEHFPAKIGTTYTINSELYRDQMPEKYKVHSKEAVENSVNSGDSISETGLSVDKELIDHAINHFNKNKDKLSDKAKTSFVENMADIGNLNTQHIATLHKIAHEQNNESAKNKLMSEHGDKLSTNIINDIVSKTKDVDSLPKRFLMNSKLPQEVIDKLHPDNYKYVRHSLLKPQHKQKLNDHIISTKNKKIEDSVNSGNPIVNNESDTLDSNLVDHAINHFNKNKDTLNFTAIENFVKNMSNINNLNAQQVSELHKIAKESWGNSSMDKLAELHGDKLSKLDLKDVIDAQKGVDYLPHKVLSNPNLPDDIIDKIHPQKYAYIKSSLLKPHHYENLVHSYLDNPTPMIRHSVEKHLSNFTKEQLQRLSKKK